MEDHPSADQKGAKRRPHPLAAAGVGFAHLPPRSTPPAAAATAASPTPSSATATAQPQQQQQPGYLRTLPSRVQRADMLESEETNVIKSWDLLTLSPQYYDDLRLRVGPPLPGGTATHAALVDEGSLADTELEVFPLELRSARAALAKAKERRSLKARLAKQGPTEDAIAAVQELKEATRNVSKWAMLRAEVILGLDCIVLVRHKATGLFLSCVTSRPGSGEGEDDAPVSSSGSGARRLVFRRDGLSPASWFRLGPPPKGNSACHVLSASTRYIVSETMLAVSPVRLPGLFVSISGNRAQLGSASKAAVFKLAKHGSKKLPLLSGATVRLFHENLGNLTTEGNQAFFYSSAPSSELESLPDLWVIEKEDHHAHPSDEEPTTTSSSTSSSTSTSRSTSKSVGKQKDDGDRDAASDPQRISLNDTFHVKHALSGQYLTLTRATRPNAYSSSSSATTSSSTTTTLSMGSAELLQTSGASASATSLESMPSFSSGSSRSLQVLLNQQRRAREEWEEAERERMQGSRQAAMPRKSSGFLSHQRDAAHKAREHAPEYHLALAPARGEWTCFSFHHPFAHEDDRKKKKSKAGSSLHLVHAATGSCLYTSPATATKTGPLHAATKGVFRAILGGGMEKAAAEKELFSVHPLPLSSPLPPAIAKAHALLQFFREAISSFKATGELPGSTIKAMSKALAELIRFCSSSADPYSPEAEPLLLPQRILIHPKFAEPLVDMWEAMTGYLQLLEQHQEQHHHHQQQQQQQQKEKHAHSGGGGGGQDSAASGSTKDPLATRIKFVLNICRLVGQAFYLVVKGNEANALAMTPHFPRLVKLVGQKVGVVDCLHEITRWNEPLLQELSPELVAPLLEEAFRHRVLKYVLILQRMCVYGGRAIPANQAIIAESLLHLSPFHLQVTGAGLVLISLAGQKKGRSFTSGFVTDFKQESDILWFDQMLLLLAALCQGANPKVALAAARVLPAESVLALVQLEEVPTKIRCRLLHAFARIYAPFYVDLEVVHDQVQALSQAAHLVAESTGEEASGSGRSEIQLMEEGQWADVKAFLLHQLGKYAEMLVPPPHKLLLPVLEAVGRLVRKGLFVGGEVEGIYITVAAILNSTKALLDPSKLSRTIERHKKTYERVARQCCDVLSARIEQRLASAAEGEVTFDAGMNATLVPLLAAFSVPTQLPLVRLLMRNQSHIFGDWWMMFEEPLFSQLDSWGKGKTAHYLQTVIKLLTLIDGVNRGKPSADANEKRGAMMLEILRLIADNFPFILPHHIAANLRLALAQDQHVDGTVLKIYRYWMQARTSFVLSPRGNDPQQQQQQHHQGEGRGGLVPEEITLCKYLRELDVAGNQLTTLPADIGQLRFLRVLRANNNLITEVPTALSYLQNLVTLDLSNNQLDSLPYSMGYMKSLQELNLAGNPLREFGKLFDQKPEKLEKNQILDCLRMINHGTVACHRIRVMLVGEGKVGKTSLVKCLKKVTTHSPSISKKIPHIKRKKAPSTIATDGINITEWTVKVHTNNKGKEPEDLSFSAWDFAGQEVYYATHQMFINPRSIYVAAFNLANATDSELQRVEYWLQSIQTRARASPVFVVGTHADDKLCSKEYLEDTRRMLQERYFQQGRFPNIQGPFFISSKTGKGIGKLHHELMKVALLQPHMQDPIPVSFLELERQLKQREHGMRLFRKPPILDLSEFRAMAVNCGMSQDEVQAAALYLNNLGVIVHFRESISTRDVVIIDPQFLTKVMSSIITIRHNFGRNGLLKHRDLPHIWKAPEFRNCRPLLLSLLQHFEVVFSITAERSLIPSLLSAEKPADFRRYWPAVPSDTKFDAGSWDDLSPRDSLPTRYASASLSPRAAAASSSLLSFASSICRTRSVLGATSSSSSSSLLEDRVHSVGRVYAFPFVPSGFFARVIVRVLNSLSITNFVLSGASQSGFASSTTATSSSSSLGASGSSLHSAIQVLWANGMVLRVSSRERVLLEFEPRHFRLRLYYRYAGAMARPGKAWGQVVTAITNVISEWYQVPATIDVICPHCLEDGRDLLPTPAAAAAASSTTSSDRRHHHRHPGGDAAAQEGEETGEEGEEGEAWLATALAPTLFKFSHCEMEYYTGHKTVECIRKRVRHRPSAASRASASTSSSSSVLQLQPPEDDHPAGTSSSSSPLLASASFTPLMAAASSSNLATTTVSMVKDRISPRREFKERGRSNTLSGTNLHTAAAATTKKEKKERKKEKEKEKEKGFLRGASSLALRGQRSAAAANTRNHASSSPSSSSVIHDHDHDPDHRHQQHHHRQQQHDGNEEPQQQQLPTDLKDGTSDLLEDDDPVAIPLGQLVPEIAFAAETVNVIAANDLEHIKEIGVGGFAIVFKALWSRSGDDRKHVVVAVKQLKMQAQSEEAMDGEGDEATPFAEFRKEVAAMSGLQHPNILSLHGVCLEPLAMVVDFMPDGPLDDFLADASRPLTWSMRLKMAMDIARAINFLHARSPPMIHRDLKSANVLLDLSGAEPLCRVADFGSCVAEFRIRRRVVDNPVWLAPEVLRGEEYSLKVDVYSFGIILYELLTRSSKLYKCQFWFQIEDMILAGTRPDIPASCPSLYRALICRCWDGNPHMRPSFDDIITSLLSFSLYASSWAD